MSLITWKDSYSVGVKELDAQHQKIFELINQLYSAMVDMKEKEIIGGVIADIADYSHYHFSTEEKYMDEFNFLEREAHKEYHKKYVEKVGQFEKEYREGKENLPQETLDFLEDWWNLHILGVDKKYSKIFNDHGLY